MASHGTDPGTIETILHPTDLSAQSEVAFAHALRLAIEHRARLYIYHVHPGSRHDAPWHELPAVRATLERWGLLEPGSSRATVGKLGITVEKLVDSHKDVVKSIVGFQKKKAVDLMVLATEGRRGLLRWRRSIAELAARKAAVPTLFVPHGARGCVRRDGAVSMKQVLVPVEQRPRADAALARAKRLLESFGTEDSALTVLYVGDEREFPAVDLSDTGPYQMQRVTDQGSASRRIVEHARSTNADLILMATEGHGGFLDMLRGSTTEQVLRRAPCPVLAVPAWFD